MFKSKNLIVAATCAMLGLSLFGNIALAQIANIPGTQPTGVSTVGQIVDLIRFIVRWVYIIFFIIAVLFIIFAAFTYLTAAGDDEKVKKAKSQIIYAAVAIIVALLSVAFETIIRTFIQAPRA